MQYQPSAETPATQNPRNKLLSKGARSLRHDELLSLLLGAITPDHGDKLDILSSAKKLMHNFGMRGLFSFESPQELSHKTELPEKKAELVMVVSEFIRRCVSTDECEINCTAEAAEFFSDLARAKQEQVHIACISPQNIVYFSDKAAWGSPDGVHCNMTELLHHPVRLFASRIVIAHNHPRGTPEPSVADLAWHAEVIRNARNFGIEVVDNIIVSPKGCSSLMDAA